MEQDEIQQIIDDIQTDEGEVKPIPTQEGMIAYRKYLWALHFIEKRIERLKEYKAQVVSDIDYKLGKEQESVDRIRKQIEMALEVDPIAERVKTGGMKLTLPDIATVSISKVTDKIIIDDAEAVLTALGQEFVKVVKPSLDTTKAKEYLETQEDLPEGARKEKSRTLSIRFNK